MRHSIKAGMAVGLATGAWMFTEYAQGLHDNPAGAGRWTGFLSLIFPVLGAWWLVRRAVPPSWAVATREGAVFGLTGGLVGGAVIYAYFALLNPDFAVAGQPVSAGRQAFIGFGGALFVGVLLTWFFYGVAGRRVARG